MQVSNDDIWKAYSRGMADVLGQGGVFVPAVLLRTYRELGISDSEAMLLLQLMLFRDTEGNEFPTPDQLAERLGASVRTVEQTIERLMKAGLLSIDSRIDGVTGVQSEMYNWTGWLLLAAELSAQEKRDTKRTARKQPAKLAADPTNLFTVFEQEFGRLLSPIELETIANWLDEDKYSDELIRFALKEAVFSGKLNFKYIDRILLEWSRNRVTNVDEARAHSQKFRGPRG
ncbi:DnaD domain protein [Paenibacillus sp. NPDC058071]|uniref:DnaD domain protein n=1 Tax=Paenibacillus sp. NPDC058071 TaxID=3346326 RepID=UPI0036D8FCF4